jgi:hypothetical protein
MNWLYLVMISPKLHNNISAIIASLIYWVWYLYCRVVCYDQSDVLCIRNWGPGGSISLVVGLPNNSWKPITNAAWDRARLCKLQKGCTRYTSDKVYQLFAHGQWFSPGTPASSTTKTGRHDIAEILMKVALKHQKSNQNEMYTEFVLENFFRTKPGSDFRRTQSTRRHLRVKYKSNNVNTNMKRIHRRLNLFVPLFTFFFVRTVRT